MFEMVCSRMRVCNRDVLEPVIELAVEIAREGREGRRVGTIFMIGDHDRVLARSRPLILDPLAGHPRDARMVTNRNLRGTIKELAQLDGGFVISADGEFVAACRYFDATADGLDLPLGLGGRHLAAASMSRVTEAIGVVVSESAVVRLFEDGALVAEILPELWMLSRRITQLRGPVHTDLVGDLAVVLPGE